MTDRLRKSLHVIALAPALVALYACAPESGVGQFYREAGAQLDQGEFGNATLHNQLAQTCNTGAGYKGGKAGSTLGDPLVVLDPASTPARPVYRVHCNGQLDGKFARVVYNEYVASAVQKTVVDAADGE